MGILIMVYPGFIPRLSLSAVAVVVFVISSAKRRANLLEKLSLTPFLKSDWVTAVLVSFLISTGCGATSMAICRLNLCVLLSSPILKFISDGAYVCSNSPTSSNC